MKAIEVFEPISACLLNAICDFSMPELPVSRETAIANSQSDFSRDVICNFFSIFSQIRHRVTGQSYLG